MKLDPQTQIEKQIEAKLKIEDSTFFELDEAFFEQLHDEIMLKVEKVEVQKVPAWQRWANRFRQKSKIISQKIGAQLVMAAVLATVIFQFSRMENRWQKTMGEQLPEAFVLQALVDPGKMSETVMTHQNESDFFLDVANRSFDDLNLNKLDQLLGSVKRISR